MIMDEIKNYPSYLDYPKPHKEQTNADRIRSMSDEDLAELIVVRIKDIHHQGMRELAYSAWLEWLQKPAEQKVIKNYKKLLTNKQGCGNIYSQGANT